MPCEPEVDYGHCPEKWVHTRASPARGLLDLAWMQDRKQSRVDEEGFRLADQLRHHPSPQGLKEAPQLAYPPMEGGRRKSPTTPGNR